MDDLLEEFSSILTPYMIAQQEDDYEEHVRREMSTSNKGVKLLPAHPESRSPYNPADIQETLKPKQRPPTRLPCANVNPSKYMVCNNHGISACSACRLVSYCSKACQEAHWSRHKRACRNPMRSDSWKPSWFSTGRLPSFVMNETLEQEESRKLTEEFSAGLALWGNIPAIDILNLPNNENNAEKDFSLAFIASGDLRHVLHSFNGLPSNYSGNLKILVNDITLPIVCRNLVLLLILGNVSDEVLAADIALHFWYSAFMPAEYRLQIAIILAKFLKELVSNEEGTSIPLGPSSNLHVILPKQCTMFFQHFISSSVTVGEIQDEYDRVRMAPSRQDYRDRMYVGLRPSHRVAFQEFRRFGIVLPFGAPNAHFNVPNLSLFSLDNKWWQTDYADPMEGWDMSSIVAAGKAHGARAEDIYGCLYFYLLKELREFAHRLRTFKSSFTMTSLDARNVPGYIRKGSLSEYNIPPSIRFDRIEVSNILDHSYVGINDVLTMWGPLLGTTKHAAIVGYFMNWISLQEDARASGAGEAVLRRLTNRVLQKNHPEVNGKGLRPELGNLQSAMINSLDDLEALYDNSKPFAAFLRKRGLNEILKKTRLRLRERHQIVPHRIATPLTAPSSALPQFVDDDAWYYYTKLTCFTWAERFVEFERA